jgi:hypothetical protein
MLSFRAAPPIPSDDPRLRALTNEELELARQANYVSDCVHPSKPVNRSGRDVCGDSLPADNIQVWRIRVYLIWFCYIYENLSLIVRPVGAIEELITEFRAPAIIDIPGRRLATLFAGIGAADPLSASEIQDQIRSLRPHYEKATSLLATLLG